uniref:C2 domain-containing protein n=1 Tax=Cucumis sativus TaxID=3659 RepID=A0A0A0KMR3_CUCSA
MASFLQNHLNSSLSTSTPNLHWTPNLHPSPRRPHFSAKPRVLTFRVTYKCRLGVSSFRCFCSSGTELQNASLQQRTEPRPFDINLAVILAGFAFEAYTSPPENFGKRELDAAGCTTVYLSESFVRETYDGQLFIKLKKGIDLPAMDPWGTSDPYVVFQLDGQIAKSKTKWGTKQPIWNEDFTLNIKEPSTKYVQNKVEKNLSGGPVRSQEEESVTYAEKKLSENIQKLLASSSIVSFHQSLVPLNQRVISKIGEKPEGQTLLLRVQTSMSRLVFLLSFKFCRNKLNPKAAQRSSPISEASDFHVCIISPGCTKAAQRSSSTSTMQEKASNSGINDKGISLNGDGPTFRNSSDKSGESDLKKRKRISVLSLAKPTMEKRKLLRRKEKIPTKTTSLLFEASALLVTSNFPPKNPINFGFLLPISFFLGKIWIKIKAQKTCKSSSLPSPLQTVS